MDAWLCNLQQDSNLCLSVSCAALKVPQWLAFSIQQVGYTQEQDITGHPQNLYNDDTDESIKINNTDIQTV